MALPNIAKWIGTAGFGELPTDGPKPMDLVLEYWKVFLIPGKFTYGNDYIIEEDNFKTSQNAIQNCPAYVQVAGRLLEAEQKVF